MDKTKWDKGYPDYRKLACGSCGGIFRVLDLYGVSPNAQCMGCGKLYTVYRWRVLEVEKYDG